MYWFKNLFKYNYGKKHEYLRRVENGIKYYSPETNHELLKRRIHYTETIILVVCFVLFVCFLKVS